MQVLQNSFFLNTMIISFISFMSCHAQEFENVIEKFKKEFPRSPEGKLVKSKGHIKEINKGVEIIRERIKDLNERVGDNKQQQEIVRNLIENYNNMLVLYQTSGFFKVREDLYKLSVLNRLETDSPQVRKDSPQVRKALKIADASEQINNKAKELVEKSRKLEKRLAKYDVRVKKEYQALLDRANQYKTKYSDALKSIIDDAQAITDHLEQLSPIAGGDQEILQARKEEMKDNAYRAKFYSMDIQVDANKLLQQIKKQKEIFRKQTSSLGVGTKSYQDLVAQEKILEDIKAKARKLEDRADAALKVPKNALLKEIVEAWYEFLHVMYDLKYAIEKHFKSSRLEYHSSSEN